MDYIIIIYHFVVSSTSASSGTELSVLVSVSSPLLVPGTDGCGSSWLSSLERLLRRGGGALLLGAMVSVGVALSLHETRR